MPLFVVLITVQSGGIIQGKSIFKELFDLTSEHSGNVWHQQGSLTLFSHMVVENLVCCVVVVNITFIQEPEYVSAFTKPFLEDIF